MSTLPSLASPTAAAMRQRVSALQAMAVLDTPPEEGFDALTRLAAMVSRTPIAIVSLIDGDRIWCKSAFGVAATTIESMASFCCEAANSKTPLHVIASATLRARIAAFRLFTSSH
jgi:hypothetical protein